MLSSKVSALSHRWFLARTLDNLRGFCPIIPRRDGQRWRWPGVHRRQWRRNLCKLIGMARRYDRGWPGFLDECLYLALDAAERGRNPANAIGGAIESELEHHRRYRTGDLDLATGRVTAEGSDFYPLSRETDPADLTDDDGPPVGTTLSGRQRQIVAWHHRDGASLRRIAMVIGPSLGTVRREYRDALDQLRRDEPTDLGQIAEMWRATPPFNPITLKAASLPVAAAVPVAVLQKRRVSSS